MANNKYIDTTAIMQVIGCVFNNPKLLDQDDRYKITEADFPDQFHRVVFGSIYNLYNPATESVAEIIDTIAYKTFLKSGEWELSAAMGMFKMGINFILMLIGNIVTKKMTGYSMYSFDN